MSYKVSFYFDSLTDIAPKFYMSRSQAIHGMKKFAYAKLEAFGKLDTSAAHDVMRAIDDCNDILAPQAEKYIRISNTGYDMICRNTKRYNT